MPLLKKLRPFFVFMEEVHLPQSQALLQEGKMFHYKIYSKIYRNSELNFLKNFNLKLSALKDPKVRQS